MTTTVKERNEKLTAALRSLRAGRTAEGQAIDLARIAAKTHSSARSFARKVALGQAKTAHRVRSRRFKG